MPNLSTYWNATGRDYYADLSQALKWLLSRQGAAPSNWLGNALFTEGAQVVVPTPLASAGLVESGLASQTNFITGVTLAGSQSRAFRQAQLENITFAMPPGLYADTQLGPDGYPINQSTLVLPWGQLLVNGYQVTTQLQAFIENQLYNAGSPTISPGDPASAGVIAKWQPNTFYKFGSPIVDHNGNVEIALVDGTTSGGTSECPSSNVPNWPTDYVGHLTGDCHQVWKLLWFGYGGVKWVASGYCYNLLQANSAYRADVFVWDSTAKLFYYQGSSSLYRTALYGNAMLNAGTFSVGGISKTGQIVAALYPTSVSAPAPGSSFAKIPAGWNAHTNMGIGYALADYKAQVYLLSGGVETLEEDDIPIIAQPDEYHARAGSSVMLDSADGAPVVRVLYDDPVSGWTEVFDSLAGSSPLADLVRSYEVPANDPLYVANPTSGGAAAIQNRSITYDNALAIIVFSVSGNLAAASSCILDLNDLITSGALARSYDRLFDRADEAAIDASAIVWTCAAYATYMQLSQDYSSWSELQAMLDWLLGMQSADSDGRLNLLYAGYDSGGTKLTNVQTADNAVAWFAFTRCAAILGAAASTLLKIGAITAAENSTLVTLAANLQTQAGNIWTALAALYIAPAGPVPGHFPHGLTNAGVVDAREDANSSGSWMALVCDANGDDVKALECVKFAYLDFILSGQTIALSSVSATYNETYQQPAAFSGVKPFTDSAGGYSGSPDVVSMEQTWGLILALARLYAIAGMQDYFGGLGTTVDALLQTLLAGQAAVFATTSDGSLLAYSASDRTPPYAMYVFPWFAATAWMYLVETNPAALLSANLQSTLLPNLVVPAGANQTIDEAQGSSSLGTFSVKVNDTTGLLRSLAGEQALLGKEARLKMGFPGMSLGDFVALHTMQIFATGADQDAWVTITLQDVQRFFGGAYLWSNGGPNEYLLGDPTTMQPPGAAWLPNAFPISDKNPRWLAGNPADLYLAAMQNELGVGQDPALAANLVSSGVDTGSVSTANPLWKKYVPGDDSTLINPNPYLDVPAILALRDGMLSGDWLQFKVTSPSSAKSWIEQQLLRPFGLVNVVRNNGQITLKTLKNAEDQSSQYDFTRANVMGVPKVDRASIVNALTFRFDVDDSAAETAARAYNGGVSYQQATSIQQYSYLYSQQVETKGMRSAYGAYGRTFLLSDWLFRRYAFGTPVYTVDSQLAGCLVEIKDYVTLTHPLVMDLINKRLGVSNVKCQVIARRPQYDKRSMQYDLIDTRQTQPTKSYLIACASAGIPDYASATPEQQQTYAFVGRNTIF